MNDFIHKNNIYMILLFNATEPITQAYKPNGWPAMQNRATYPAIPPLDLQGMASSKPDLETIHSAVTAKDFEATYMSRDELGRLRTEIDSLDEGIIRIFALRFIATGKVDLIKAAQGLEAVDPSREVVVNHQAIRESTLK